MSTITVTFEGGTLDGQVKEIEACRTVYQPLMVGAIEGCARTDHFSYEKYDIVAFPEPGDSPESPDWRAVFIEESEPYCPAQAEGM